MHIAFAQGKHAQGHQRSLKRCLTVNTLLMLAGLELNDATCYCWVLLGLGGGRCF